MMMYKKIGIVLAGMIACWGASAQTLAIRGTYDAGDVGDLELGISPLGGSGHREGVKVEASGSEFKADVPVSETGFYSLYGRRGGTQLVLPLYIPQSEGTYRMALSWEGNRLKTDTGNDNNALFAYGKVIGEKDRYFWDKGRTFTPEELLQFLKSYKTVADSIANANQCSDAVRFYLDIWAYTSALGSYGFVPRAVGIKVEDLPFSKGDFMPDSHEIWDTPAASCFPAVVYMVRDNLPKGGLSETLSYLYGHYKSESIRGKVADLVADRYVRRFDYSGDYARGLAELEEAIAEYGLDARYAEEFARRRSSTKGSPFPSVNLVDAEGQPMDFSQFKGYYVYIDLWASWCGPCCREVPFLQELEQNLRNPAVKFLSISIDNDANAWKNKMKALDMHGNQCLDAVNAIGNALNVQGIPRFLIYDKEGRLYNGNAPRPSSSEVLELLESLK